MILRTVIYKLAYFTGITHLFLWINRRKQVAVCYHNVVKDELFDNSVHLGVSVTLAEFRSQLDLIGSKFSVTTTLDEPHSCVLTFDDLNRNNLTAVLPELEARGLAGYFFVPLSKVRGELPWIDKLLYWISYAPEGTYSLPCGTSLTISNSSRASAWSEIWSWINTHYPLRHDLVKALTEVQPLESLACNLSLIDERFGYLNSQEILRIKQTGSLLGAHSADHDILSKLDSYQLHADFAACSAEIGHTYNTTIYCYPFGGPGDINDEVIAECAANGFTGGFVNVSGPVKSPFERTRVYLGRATDKAEIFAKLSGIDHLLKRILGTLKHRSQTLISS